MKHNRLFFLVGIYFLILLGYLIFSYSLTDPNLVLTSWEPYWQFQSWLWQNIYSNPQTLALLFGLLVLALFAVYSWFVVDKKLISQLSFEPTKKTIFVFLLMISPLLFSYNALSHDVFNYIFNAKMVVVYGANPHQEVALNYPDDLWTRFMHNTHTPAPYGYGWTGLSVLPYVLGSSKFTMTWFLFRAMSLLSMVGLYFGIQFLSQSIRSTKLKVSELAVIFLNPLILIELISNSHNDLWMIVPAIFALTLMLHTGKKFWYEKSKWIIALILLIISISIKFATIALLPVFAFVYFERMLLQQFLQAKVPVLGKIAKVSDTISNLAENFWKPYVPLVCSILLFLPLLVPRSQFFHPWYLVWSLVWLPLINHRWWKMLLLLFSFTSLLRYIPWMIDGGFKEQTLMYQQLITWSAVFFLVLLNRQKSRRVSRI